MITSVIIIAVYCNKLLIAGRNSHSIETGSVVCGSMDVHVRVRVHVHQRVVTEKNIVFFMIQLMVSMAMVYHAIKKYSTDDIV